MITASTDVALLGRLALALAIGLLIGLERGWSGRAAPEHSRVAGLRTFGVIGLAGGLTGAFGTSAQILLTGAGLVGVSIILAVGYWLDAARAQNFSATTAVSGLLVFLLGAFAAVGYPLQASAMAVMATIILAQKQPLHQFVARLRAEELHATLRFLLIAVVIFPWLPNRGYGPYQALNPFELWSLVVLISGLSFAGYIAVRLLGAGRGLVLTALVGAIVSSTAVTLSLSRSAHQSPGAARAYASAILLACAVMPVRMALLIGVLNRPLLMSLAWSLATLSLATLAAGGLCRHIDTSPEPAPVIDQANPLDLAGAFGSTAMLAVVIVALEAAHHWFGARGFYAVTAMGGLADVDAITLSIARLPIADVPIARAAIAIALAASANTLLKSALVIGLAPRVVGLWVVGGLTSASLIAASTFFWVG